MDIDIYEIFDIEDNLIALSKTDSGPSIIYLRTVSCSICKDIILENQYCRKKQEKNI